MPPFPPSLYFPLLRVYYIWTKETVYRYLVLLGGARDGSVWLGLLGFVFISVLLLVFRERGRVGDLGVRDLDIELYLC